MGEKVAAKLNELTKIAETISNDTTKNNRTISDAFMNLAECHFSVGNYKASAYYYEQAFKFRRSYVLDRDNAKCCIMAGIAHFRSGNVIQAERFFGYAIPAAKQANSNYYTCIGTSNMALVQLVQGRSTRAVELATDSLDMAKSIFSPSSPECLEFVRLLVNVLIQSNRFETADNLIQESKFSPDERAVLRAGIASILEDYDKAIAILKEAETLRAELSSSIPSLPAINSPQEPSVEAKSIENVGIPGEESLLDPKLDNGKRKEYSYREKMAVCLVNYNLSIMYSYVANHELERAYLEKACDGMVLLLSQVTNETNETSLVQSASDRINRENVLPTLDTILSVHLLHSHVMLSKIVNRFTYSPLLPSIKLQSCHSFHENDEEYPEIIQIISELNSLFLLWEQNTVLSTMSEIETFQKSNPITVLSVKNIVSESSGAPLLSMQSNSMSLESSDVSAVTEDYNDIANVDSMIAQQLVANVSLLTSYSTTGALKNPSEFNLLTRSTSLPPDSSTLSPLPSPRSSKKPNLKKKDGKKDSNAASAPKKKKKVPSTKTKSQTNIPTHGSIKIEMVPQCHLAKIEGLSEYDKVISNALYQINGIGYGFMFGGSTEMDRSHINPDNPDEYTDEYLDRLNSLKKQLQETETTLVPIYDDLNQLPLSIISNQHRNIHGTLLSLYLTLCQLCFQLNHRKETNLYIEKYIKYCETHLHGDIHHLAIGYRLQLDMEEWMVSATLSSMISQQKLKRYQELLLMVKKYYQLTERIQHVDCELYFDAWKRLINVYADISTVPDTPGTPKPPSTETLMENLSLLTPDEIDQLEETDLGWLKLYSRIRAKSLATKLTVAMKSKYNDLMKSEEESAIVGGDGAAGG